MNRVTRFSRADAATACAWIAIAAQDCGIEITHASIGRADGDDAGLEPRLNINVIGDPLWCAIEAIYTMVLHKVEFASPGLTDLFDGSYGPSDTPAAACVDEFLHQAIGPEHPRAHNVLTCIVRESLHLAYEDGSFDRVFDAIKDGRDVVPILRQRRQSRECTAAQIKRVARHMMGLAAATPTTPVNPSDFA